MNIRRIFYALVRKWWLILLLVVIGGGIGYLKVYFTKPVYQADTTLYMIDRNNVTTQNQIVRQYYEVINSRKVTSAALQELKNYDLSESQILSMISIISIKDANIFTVRARGSDPTVTTAVANATAHAFLTTINQMLNCDYVGILDEAQVPNNPVPVNVLSIILTGIFTGIIGSLGIIYIIEYFDTTVHSDEDIIIGLKVSVIGIIPEHNIR